MSLRHKLDENMKGDSKLGLSIAVLSALLNLYIFKRKYYEKQVQSVSLTLTIRLAQTTLHGPTKQNGLVRLSCLLFVLRSGNI